MSLSGVPHWINASNPEGKVVVWNAAEWLAKDSDSWSYSNWHEPSQQPNDCIVPETCIFIGPDGKVT